MNSLTHTLKRADARKTSSTTRLTLSIRVGQIELLVVRRPRDEQLEGALAVNFGVADVNGFEVGEARKSGFKGTCKEED